MLYETISLHSSRWEEMLRCLWTLESFPSKARLVRTLLMTVTEDDDSEDEGSDLPVLQKNSKASFEALMSHLGLALRHMSSLRVLSVWAPPVYDIAMTKVESAIRFVSCSYLSGDLCSDWKGLRRQDFKLTRLYISGIDYFEDFPELLINQPKLEAVCLWNETAYDDWIPPLLSLIYAVQASDVNHRFLGKAFISCISWT